MNRDDSRASEFLLLLDKHEQQIRAFIFAMVPNYADAQEIAQQVRMILWEQFEEYDVEKDFGAWARTIAYFQILAFRKKMSRNREYFSQEFLEKIAEKASQDQTSDLYQARTEALETCVQKLSESNRQLLLRWYEGTVSLKQLAKNIGRTYAATRQAMKRIRNSLSKCINKELSKEEVNE